MLRVKCQICGKSWIHDGPGPIEDHCTSVNSRLGEYLMVYGQPK